MAKYLDDFLEWYAIYPRHTAKAAAQLKWKAAIKAIAKENKWGYSKTKEWLNGVTRTYAKSDVGRGEFVPHPATWLSQARYDDDQKEWFESRGSSPATSRVVDTTRDMELVRAKIVRQMQREGVPIDEPEVQRRIGEVMRGDSRL